MSESTKLDLTTDTRLPLCPKCGKHGRGTAYVDGSGQFVHSMKVTLLGNVAVPEVLTACVIKSEQPVKERKGRNVWLALLNAKAAHTQKQRQRNFAKAVSISFEVLFTLLSERGWVWVEVDEVWRRGR